MPGCVLRVSGKDFAVDAFLVGSTLQPYRIHHCGEMRRRAGAFLHSGLSVDISEADGQLAEQVSDAIRFLTQHESELHRLRNFPGVTDLRLDFGYYYRDVAAQYDYLPPEFLARAGGLNIGIELSLYHVSTDPNPAR